MMSWYDIVCLSMIPVIVGLVLTWELRTGCCSICGGRLLWLYRNRGLNPHSTWFVNMVADVTAFNSPPPPRP